jgi:hypothetical protein
MSYVERDLTETDCCLIKITYYSAEPTESLLSEAQFRKIQSCLSTVRAARHIFHIYGNLDVGNGYHVAPRGETRRGLP